jgi:hypothetical protein
MEHVAAWARQPAADPVDDDLVGSGDQQHRVQFATCVAEGVGERIGLPGRARKAAEHESPGRVSRNRIQQHRDDDLVRHETARGDVSGRITAELGPVGAMAPEEIAGGQVGQAEVRAEPDRLRPLAGAWRAEQ